MRSLSLQFPIDKAEVDLAESQLQDNDGFDSFKAGLNGFGGGSSAGKSSTLKRDYSMDVSYDEHEMLQVRWLIMGEKKFDRNISQFLSFIFSHV